MDKPRPTGRPRPPYDLPDYYPEGGPVYPQETPPATGSVVSNIYAAYKINPVLIAMIVLLLTILGALGYYMMRNDDRVYGYIALRDKRENDLWDRLVEMARKCRDKETDSSQNFPIPNFPNLTTGGPSFSYPPDKKSRN